MLEEYHQTQAIIEGLRAENKRLQAVIDKLLQKLDLTEPPAQYFITGPVDFWRRRGDFWRRAAIREASDNSQTVLTGPQVYGAHRDLAQYIMHPPGPETIIDFDLQAIPLANELDDLESDIEATIIQEGRQARENGALMVSNPYADQYRHILWLNGWMEVHNRKARQAYLDLRGTTHSHIIIDDLGDND